MPAALLKQDRSVNEGTDRSTVTELWHVYDILGLTDENTRTAVFSQIPRDLDSVHPDVPEAICRNRVLRRTWTNRKALNGVTYWQALVAVYFDSSGRNTVFNPRSRSISNFVENISIPYWYPVVNGTSPYKKGFIQAERTRIRRIETRHPRTAQVTEGAIEAIFAQVGAVYSFGTGTGPIIDPVPNAGTPYLFKGPQIVTLANGLTRIQYVFDTTCRILPLPQGGLATDIPYARVPGLDYLDEYAAHDGKIVTGQPPEVLVSHWYDRYPEGTGIPFL